MDVITYALCKGNGGGGSGGGALVVNGTWNEDWSTCTLDKTWQELFDADFAVLHLGDGESEKDTYILVQAYIAPFSDVPYAVIFCQALAAETNRMGFYTDLASGYPVFTGGGE